jgi:uncharacterized protein with HEPN domain
MNRQPVSPEDRLADMLDAAQTCIGWIDGLSAQQLAEDAVRFQAVCKMLVILGEAASHIPSTLRVQLSAIPWRKVVGLRNLIVHEYWAVERGLIFLIVRNQMPSLVTVIDASLKERESP